MNNFYKHKAKIEIRFSDLDVLGHVNNAHYLSYFEQARINYFKEAIGNNINWAKKGVILASATLDFLKPIFLNDNIFVFTKCQRVGKKSFILLHSIVKETPRGEDEVARGTTVMVCFDYENRSSMDVPNEWKDKLTIYEYGNTQPPGNAEHEERG